MHLEFPVPNVTCRCGWLLLSWEDVERHFQKHRAEREAMKKAMKRYDEFIKAGVKANAT